MAVSSERWFETVVPASYTDLRKLKKTLEAIKDTGSMQYKIKPDRDRLVIMTSRCLTKEEKERIKRPLSEPTKPLRSSPSQTRSQTPQPRNQDGDPDRTRPKLLWLAAIKAKTPKKVVKWGTLKLRGKEITAAEKDSRHDQVDTEGQQTTFGSS
jgi:hypothetical protein